MWPSQYFGKPKKSCDLLKIANNYSIVHEITGGKRKELSYITEKLNIY